jgi:mannosyl-3-phosphoglycerate phosphatase
VSDGAPAWWVVTDLDGTLLDHAYDWSAAAATLARLGRHGIPVIPCTSKTAEEVRVFRREAGLRDPFIVENGGAIHGEDQRGEWRMVLGADAARLRNELTLLADRAGLRLRPLAACSVAEVRALTGLDGAAAERARRREWSVPFLLEEPARPGAWADLEAAAAARGLKLLQGNRLAHLIDAASDKGLALAALRRRCGGPATRVLALGDSPNDRALLEAADVAVVVPGAAGPHPEFRSALAEGRYRLAPAPHARGWAAAVAELLF